MLVEIPDVAIVMEASTVPPIWALSKYRVSPLVYPEPPLIISAEVIEFPAPETTTFAVAPSQLLNPTSL